MYSYSKMNFDDPSPCYGCTDRYPGCACEKYLIWKENLQQKKRSYQPKQCSSRYHGKPVANGSFQRQARKTGAFG